MTNADGSVSGGCVFPGSSLSETMISRTADGRYLLVPCYSTAVGTATTTGALNRTVLLVSDSGAIDATTVFTTTANENFRGVASVNGSQLYISTNSGLKTVSEEEGVRRE